MGWRLDLHLRKGGKQSANIGKGEREPIRGPSPERASRRSAAGGPSPQTCRKIPQILACLPARHGVLTHMRTSTRTTAHTHIHRHKQLLSLLHSRTQTHRHARLLIILGRPHAEGRNKATNCAVALVRTSSVPSGTCSRDENVYEPSMPVTTDLPTFGPLVNVRFTPATPWPLTAFLTKPAADGTRCRAGLHRWPIGAAATRRPCSRDMASQPAEARRAQRQDERPWHQAIGSSRHDERCRTGMRPEGDSDGVGVGTGDRRRRGRRLCRRARWRLEAALPIADGNWCCWGGRR